MSSYLYIAYAYVVPRTNHIFASEVLLQLEHWLDKHIISATDTLNTCLKHFY